MRARALMVQGTASHVGKSVLCTALCRIFRQDGLRVAPFKAQNMSLNAYVTADGGEIGRAQGVQAEAARVEATVDMNPILLKPKGNSLSQVVVRGRAWGDVHAGVYYSADYIEYLWETVRASLARLLDEFEVVVIEGAGSPAEVNLQSRDLANMRVAALVDAPVILVADIERGGVFASVVGTFELLPESERRLLRGIVLNKFRGDVRILTPGIEFLERRTGRPVLGVLPYVADLGVEAEDGVSLSHWRPKAGPLLDLAVARLPHIANFTDFDPLSLEPDVALRYVRHPAALGWPDILFLPGTKNTTCDLVYLYESGWADAVKAFVAGGGLVVGICGGYQMLGRELRDPLATESDVRCVPGLGLLDVTTVFRPDKTTRRAVGSVLSCPGPLGEAEGEKVTGYEIHAGETHRDPGTQPVFALHDNAGDGAINTTGTVWGTYLHGLFEADGFRRRWLNALRRRRGLAPLPVTVSLAAARETAFDRLAAVVRRHLKMDSIYGWLGLRPAQEAPSSHETA
ncbi:MAG: cobyric acid synthase [Desulfotomaculales bacterium]